MAQNVTVAGASYTDVPAVNLPKTGGGTATFTDVSDTTAVAGDVAQGKYFYGNDGIRIEGTATGGGDDDSWLKRDGNTYLHVSVTDFTKHFFINMGSGNAGLKIDFGDETAPVYPETGSHVYIEHEYQTAGDYIIKFTPADGSNNFWFNENYGSNTISAMIREASDNAYGTKWRSYYTIVKKIEIGKKYTLNKSGEFIRLIGLKKIHFSSPIADAKIADYCFAYCHKLESITWDDGVMDSVRTLGNSLIYECHMLKEIPFFPSVTTLPQNMAVLSSSMDGTVNKIIIPVGVTVLNSSCFRYQNICEYVEIPSTVTSIAAYSFDGTFCMKEVHIKATTPPSLANSNAFIFKNGNAAPCVLYVPYSEDHSILTAYQTATNWSTFASYMQEESA